MDQSFVELLAAHYRRVHDRVLVLIDDLGEQQLSWQPFPGSRSIACGIVHLTRSSEELQRNLAGLRATAAHVPAPPQHAPSAGELPEPARPPSPGEDEHTVHAGRASQKENLLEDARRTFAAVEQLFPAPRPDALDGPALDALSVESANALLHHLARAHQHLGEIACMLGLQGQCAAVPGRAGAEGRPQQSDRA